jgi:hypothetical protein
MLIYRLKGYDHIETRPSRDPIETAPASAHSRPSLA